jgi:hypothetical protein
VSEHVLVIPLRSVAELDIELLRVIRAGQLATAISGATTVELGADPAVELGKLLSARFDQAPVRDADATVGWVRTLCLEGAESVGAVSTPLARSPIVSAEAPMEQLLRALGDHGFVFVVDEAGLSGFVTPSDLDRHAARSHFQLLISGIEMLLTQLVRSVVPESQVVRILRKKEAARWQLAVAADRDTNPVEYLYLDELARLFARSTLAVPERGWTDSLTSCLMHICKFRNNVFHSNQPLVTKKRTATDIAVLAETGTDLANTLVAIARAG